MSLQTESKEKSIVKMIHDGCAFYDIVKALMNEYGISHLDAALKVGEVFISKGLTLKVPQPIIKFGFPNKSHKVGV